MPPNSSCFYDYNILNEDKQSYSSAWSLNQTTTNQLYSKNVINAFDYIKSSSLNDSIFFGKYAQYLGGGYVYRLDSDPATIQSDLNTLQQLSWIDKRTRAVFIEFTLFNPNLNLFSYSEMFFEILPSGNLLPSAKFTSTSFWSPSK